MRFRSALRIALPFLAVLSAGEDPGSEYVRRAEKLSGAKDPKGWVELADFAEGRMLFKKREEALRRALEQDPDQAEAHQRLGEARAGNGWKPAGEVEAAEQAEHEAKGLAYYGNKWIQPKEAEKLRQEDRKAEGWDLSFRLDTPRLRIYSARSPEFTRRLAAVFESEMDAYRRLYGGVWKLPAQPKPILVYLFADRETFARKLGPCYGGRVPPTLPGLYLGDINYVGMTEDPGFTDEHVLKSAAHEMLHALDNQWAGLSSQGLPLWILEGRANHFGFGVQGRLLLPGRVALAPDDPMLDSIKTAVPSLRLSELAGLGKRDFYARPQLAYPVSVALVHFLFHGEGGRHARGFRAFLAGLPAKSSKADLEAALGAKLEDLQPAFEAHVRDRFLPSASPP